MEKQKSGINQIIYGRCKVLTEILNSSKNIYKCGNENQKAFIETIIGAAIWYIPKPKNYWTGKISIEAIKSFLQKNEKQKLSEEHDIPRKVAAKTLLDTDDELTVEYVEKQYIEKFCKLHYITPEENKRAIKYQKTNVYQSSEEVYKNANIELVEIKAEQLKQIKLGNVELIKNIINEAIRNST